jgi:hypothetical protein
MKAKKYFFRLHFVDKNKCYFIFIWPIPISLQLMNMRPLITHFCFPLLLLSCCLVSFKKLEAQYIINTDHDSTYFETYPEKLVGRFYFSKKYTNLELESKDKQNSIVYRPNTTLNMGIGATYKILTLNLAYGFGFLNPEKGKGQTEYLDLQTHLYGIKWTIDLYGQFYKGYYLAPKGIATPGNDSYYLRPDLGVILLGATAYYTLNEKKFSYRAAMVQSAWQKKSAGSFLLGGEIYYGYTSGDSAFVPQSIGSQFNQTGIRSLGFVELGPSAGYAYTAVFKQHFFLTGSFAVNFDVGVSTEKAPSHAEDRVTFTPNYIYRFVLGYNSNSWNINLSQVGNRVSIRGASSQDRYIIGTGNFRLTYAKRFTPGPKLRKRLRPLDNFLQKK